MVTLSHWLKIFDTLGSGGAIVPAILIVALWEMFWPEHKNSLPFIGRWANNFALYLMSIGTTAVIAPTLALLTNEILGYSPLRWSPGDLGFWVHLAYAFLVLDGLNYALHRAMHAIPPLWRLHALHHSDVSLDVSTTVRHHPGEAIVAALAIGVIGALLGCSALEVGAYAVVETAVQVLGHADVRLPKFLDRTIGEIFVTPRFHRTHHSSERVETNSNYGQLFAFWDRLFGTFAGLAGDERSIEYGLKQFRDSRSQRLDQLLLLPVRINDPN